MYAKRWEDEELLFDELCSQALNADRIIDIDLLYKLEDEVSYSYLIPISIH
jgi:hypothetical protein